MDKTLQVSNEADTESNENVNSEETPKIDPEVEKSLVRRMDLILLPTLCKTQYYPQIEIQLTGSSFGLPNPQPRPRQSWKRQIRNSRTRPWSRRKPILITSHSVLHPLLPIRYPCNRVRETVQFCTGHPAVSIRMGQSSHDSSRDQELWRANGL